MKTDPLAREVLATWKRHQQILMFLVQRIPEKQLGALPTASSGRDVARQLAHLNRTRLGWLSFHATGQRPQLPKAASATKKELAAALKESGKAIEELLAQALRKEARIRLFGKSPVRWMGYLIAHESHHRGAILLALKQNGFTLAEKASADLWGKWMFGK